MVLPGAFPNLLANGASGIAVGMATSIPPHNAAELCDAALHLIKTSQCRRRKADAVRARPGLPDRRHHHRQSRDHISKPMPPAGAPSGCAPAGRRSSSAAAPGRSSSPKFPIRSRRAGSSSGSPSCYRRRSCRCSPMSATKSAEDVRLVLEPKSRTVDPRILMEQLFRSTDLEARIPLNMNVLSRGRVPGVLSLRRCCGNGSITASDVLLRRSQPPPGRDRPPARSARRLSHRLSQSRRGDPHHPRARTNRSRR